MICKVKENEYRISSGNGVGKIYRLLTNVPDNELDLAKLAIVFLKLKECIVVANAFNIYGDTIPDMTGVYIDKDKLDSEPYLFDKFHNTLLIMKEELEKQEEIDEIDKD